MIENRTFLLLLLMSFVGFSQTKGVIKDSITGQPIPYVSVWVENETIGTTAEFNGEFVINTNDKNKNLVFSALGYQTKIISLKNINTVTLSPKSIELNEVIIGKRKGTNEIVVGDFSGINLNSGVSNAGQENVHIWAKIIRFNDKIKEHPYIKSIEFVTRSELKNSLLRIRIFNIDKQEIPIGDAIDDNILVKVKKGTNPNKVDLSGYNIKIPEEGVLIGFEYLKLEQNKIVYQGNIRYAPSILGFFPGGNTLIKLSQDGVVFPNITGKYGNVEIALKIKLSN
ncbi:carboxypeptidase-like regulatory domain-containing protein [Flavobacterium sp.]|uniref:carboxypeptidase-like regulatory domain-containing protein n=1 Tax=Flavobacterium sp. TaxID=239 RepID=UPI002639D6B8|nr:carboxypeptidase-like regulatory domain-containing protein [Flavobacterium sp.]MDD3004331.1 carboxypeptidase-like regulatory domain-containing protein [Flavobacterium sp.]